MTERVPINPGRVEWSGDNPGIYLRQAANDPFVTRPRAQAARQTTAALLRVGETWICA